VLGAALLFTAAGLALGLAVLRDRGTLGTAVGEARGMASGPLRRALELSQPRPPGKLGTALLRVESEPAGAEVYLGAELLGLTPWMGDNDYPPGEHTLRLVLPGRLPTHVRFEGGRDAVARARLAPAPARRPLTPAR
jgi:hypothetical protein